MTATKLDFENNANLATVAKEMVKLRMAVQTIADVLPELLEVLMNRLNVDAAKLSGVAIEELDLQVRPYNVLRREGIATLGQLCALTEVDLLEMRNMGEGAIRDIKHCLSRIGLELKEVLPPDLERQRKMLVEQDDQARGWEGISK